MSIEAPYFQQDESRERLSKWGGNVAVVGGGPAGSFCALLLARAGISVDIFEPRTPRLLDVVQGEKRIPCTGCAGLLQVGAITLLKKYGLDLPRSVIQAKLTETTIIFPGSGGRITLPIINTTVYRGLAPVKQFETHSPIEGFDAWLLSEAIGAGAKHHEVVVTDVNLQENSEGKVSVTDAKGETYARDLIIGSFGHNSQLMSKIKYPDGVTKLEAPQTQGAGVREYFVPEANLPEDFGKAALVFANPTKRILFGAIYPKGVFREEPRGRYVTIALMGREDIAAPDFKWFLEVAQKNCPLSIDPDARPSCGCIKPITVQSPDCVVVANSTGEKMHMATAGDTGGTRPKKDGIGAALDSAETLALLLI